MVRFIRDSSFVQNAVYNVRAKNCYLDIRERIPALESAAYKC